MSHHSTSFSCFRPTSAVTTSDNHHYSPPPFINGNPNLTTCLYHTNLGIFSLTWSNTLFGHSLHLQLHHHHNNNSASSSPVSLSNHHHHHPLSLITLFHLHIKPFTFWKKTGSKKLSLTNSQIFWDLTRAKFGSRPEPQSGFYIVVVVENEIALIVGDLVKEGYSKTKSLNQGIDQALILRREHVYGNNNNSNKVYTTKARLNGRDREISIDCTVNCDAKLIFNVDGKRVLLIKRLKWKFRGNEKIEVDGVTVQVSWDVYNWLFDSGSDNAHAVFMFRFEEPNNDNNIDMKKICCDDNNNIDEGAAPAGGGGGNDDKSSKLSFGLNGIEWRKMRRSLLLRTARSSSSSSLSMTSSVSSGCSSSVMEWASSTTEDSELNNGPVGFSLLVYAWRK